MNVCKRIEVLILVIFLLCCDNASARRNPRNRNTNRKPKCRIPDPVENAELKEKYKGKNKFNDGDKIEYDCEMGYTIEGISRERECRNGKWSDIQFNCNEIFCSWLPHPENGRRVDGNSQTGFFTNFECNIGYQIRGDERLLCRIDGEWYPPEIPVCDPILCPPLPQIQNGWVFQDMSDGLANNYESVAEYGCNRDYYLNGNPKHGRVRRTCRADGTWSGQEPFCDVPKCNFIMDFFGGYVDYFGGRSRDAQAVYICNENYTRMPDVDMSTCEKDLQWHPPPPNCYSKSAVRVPENGFVRGHVPNILIHGKTYDIQCKTGYEVESDGILTNRIEKTKTIQNNNGTLEPTVQCLEERCDPGSQDNGYVKYKGGNTRIRSKFPSGTRVSLSCNDGFQFYDDNGQPLQSSPERLCRKGEIINAPKCIEEKCSLAKQPTNSFTRYRDPNKMIIISKPSTEYIDSRQRIEVFCDGQYELYVNDSKRYLDAPFIASCRKGKFDKNKFPVCIAKRCDPGSLRNGYVKYKDNSRIRSKFPSGTRVSLSCNDGFQFYDNNGQPLQSSPERLCKKGEIINAPKCIEEKCSLAKQPSNQFTRYRDPKTKEMISKSSVEYIDSRQRIEVFCDELYELYVKDSKKYLAAPFIAWCRKGKFNKNKFPICLEKRCYFRSSEPAGTCLFYDDPRKCIREDFYVQSGSMIKVSCKTGYQLFVSEKKIKGQESLYCQKGTYPRFQCIPKNCTVPEVKNIEPLTKEVYKHGDEVTFTCKEGYCFGKKHSPKGNSTTSKCEFGKWSPDVPTKCKPAKCFLNIQDGTNYTLYGTNTTLIKAEHQDSGTNISIQCMEKFDLFDDNDTLINDTGSIRVVTCYLGKWKNAHFCKKQCLIPSIEHVQFSKDGKIVTPNDTIIHNEIVNVTCKHEEISVTCTNGYLKGIENCIPTTTTSATATSATSSSDSATKSTQRNSTEASNESTDQGKDNSKGESDDIDSDNETTDTEEAIDNVFSEQAEGCILSDDKRFKYVDMDYNNISPGEKVGVGIKLRVICNNPDLYSFLTYDYEADDNDTYYGEVENTIITCNEDNEMSQHHLECPEVASNDECMKVDNGEVKKSNGYYLVSCNEGFSLNTIVPEGERCTCDDGRLTSIIGGQPKCIPDPCVVPYEFDSLISILNRQFISLSGGSIVDVGDLVYFNCSKASEMAYEPFNRRFKCVNGLWIEDERDKTWKFGNNGTFPKCRKAECKEECQNGGVCFKDNECRCKHLTEGKLCEHVICDDACIANGGKCVGPGKCECPQGKFGNNCGKRGCVLPQIENMARLETSRTIFAPGESLRTFHCDKDYVLSSDSGMMCRNDGLWSEIVMCEKGVKYRIMVKTRNSLGAGTDGHVYITLFGVRGRSNRIQLNGDFERNDFDSTDVTIRDIHPIKLIQIEHDGEGFTDDWDLDYVNVYIEHVQETYRFTNKEKISITNERDLTLDHDGFYYLIRTKTGSRNNNNKLRGRVYITLIGATGRTRKIYLHGDFVVDETRERMKDIRPIERVEIGHDAEGSLDLEYVSIYVENMEEFYIFRNNEGRMIDSSEDLLLDREGNSGCINTFGGDLNWFPIFNRGITFYLGHGQRMSHRSCKQACINEQHRYCRGVYYNSKHDNACYGLLETDKSFFRTNQKYRGVYVYLRECKN